MFRKPEVRVVCRFKPLSADERERGKARKANSSPLCVIFDDQHVEVLDRNGPYSPNQSRSPSPSRSQRHNTATKAVLRDLSKHFTLDEVFSDAATQADLYERVGSPVVRNVLKGYNGTVLAYGQTGSGKTHSMVGPEGGRLDVFYPDSDAYDMRGMTPRIVEDLFSALYKMDSQERSWTVRLSVFEVYKEEIMDLLVGSSRGRARSASAGRGDYRIREDVVGGKGIYIESLSCPEAETAEEVLGLIKTAMLRRKTAITNFNETSSRSHSLVCIYLHQVDHTTGEGEGGVEIISQLNLVDLAGSEKVAKTLADGERLKEAQTINLSLTLLGNVIYKLTDGRSGYVPYRDSKLTRILQESLGGNSLTTLVCHCSIAMYNREETLSTLRFANRAKRVRNKPRINRELTAKELKLQLSAAQQQIQVLEQKIQLNNEIHQNALKNHRSQKEEGEENLKTLINSLMKEIEELREELQLKEEELQHQTNRVELYKREAADIAQELDDTHKKHAKEKDILVDKLSKAQKDNADLVAQVEALKKELSKQMQNPTASTSPQDLMRIQISPRDELPDSSSTAPTVAGFGGAPDSGRSAYSAIQYDDDDLMVYSRDGTVKRRRVLMCPACEHRLALPAGIAVATMTDLRMFSPLFNDRTQFALVPDDVDDNGNRTLTIEPPEDMVIVDGKLMDSTQAAQALKASESGKGGAVSPTTAEDPKRQLGSDEIQRTLQVTGQLLNALAASPNANGGKNGGDSAAAGAGKGTAGQKDAATGGSEAGTGDAETPYTRAAADPESMRAIQILEEVLRVITDAIGKDASMDPTKPHAQLHDALQVSERVLNAWRLSDGALDPDSLVKREREKQVALRKLNDDERVHFEGHLGALVEAGLNSLAVHLKDKEASDRQQELAKGTVYYNNAMQHLANRVDQQVQEEIVSAVDHVRLTASEMEDVNPELRSAFDDQLQRLQDKMLSQLHSRCKKLAENLQTTSVDGLNALSCSREAFVNRGIDDMMGHLSRLAANELEQLTASGEPVTTEQLQVMSKRLQDLAAVELRDLQADHEQKCKAEQLSAVEASLEAAAEAEWQTLSGEMQQAAAEAIAAITHAVGKLQIEDVKEREKVLLLLDKCQGDMTQEALKVSSSMKSATDKELGVLVATQREKERASQEEHFQQAQAVSNADIKHMMAKLEVVALYEQMGAPTNPDGSPLKDGDVSSQPKPLTEQQLDQLVAHLLALPPPPEVLRITWNAANAANDDTSAASPFASPSKAQKDKRQIALVEAQHQHGQDTIVAVGDGLLTVYTEMPKLEEEYVKICDEALQASVQAHQQSDVMVATELSGRLFDQIATSRDHLSDKQNDVLNKGIGDLIENMQNTLLEEHRILTDHMVKLFNEWPAADMADKQDNMRDAVDDYVKEMKHVAADEFNLLNARGVTPENVDSLHDALAKHSDELIQRLGEQQMRLWEKSKRELLDRVEEIIQEHLVAATETMKVSTAQDVEKLQRDLHRAASPSQSAADLKEVDKICAQVVEPMLNNELDNMMDSQRLVILNGLHGFDNHYTNSMNKVHEKMVDQLKQVSQAGLDHLEQVLDTMLKAEEEGEAWRATAEREIPPRFEQTVSPETVQSLATHLDVLAEHHQGQKQRQSLQSAGSVGKGSALAGASTSEAGSPKASVAIVRIEPIELTGVREEWESFAKDGNAIAVAEQIRAVRGEEHMYNQQLRQLGEREKKEFAREALKEALVAKMMAATEEAQPHLSDRQKQQLESGIVQLAESMCVALAEAQSDHDQERALVAATAMKNSSAAHRQLAENEMQRMVETLQMVVSKELYPANVSPDNVEECMPMMLVTAGQLETLRAEMHSQANDLVTEMCTKQHQQTVDSKEELEVTLSRLFAQEQSQTSGQLKAIAQEEVDAICGQMTRLQPTSNSQESNADEQKAAIEVLRAALLSLTAEEASRVAEVMSSIATSQAAVMAVEHSELALTTEVEIMEQMQRFSDERVEGILAALAAESSPAFVVTPCMPALTATMEGAASSATVAERSASCSHQDISSAAVAVQGLLQEEVQTCMKHADLSNQEYYQLAQHIGNLSPEDKRDVSRRLREFMDQSPDKKKQQQQGQFGGEKNPLFDSERFPSAATRDGEMGEMSASEQQMQKTVKSKTAIGAVDKKRAKAAAKATGSYHAEESESEEMSDSDEEEEVLMTLEERMKKTIRKISAGANKEKSSAGAGLVDSEADESDDEDDGDDEDGDLTHSRKAKKGKSDSRKSRATKAGRRPRSKKVTLARKRQLSTVEQAQLAILADKLDALSAMEGQNPTAAEKRRVSGSKSAALTATDASAAKFDPPQRMTQEELQNLSAQVDSLPLAQKFLLAQQLERIHSEALPIDEHQERTRAAMRSVVSFIGDVQEGRNTVITDAAIDADVDPLTLNHVLSRALVIAGAPLQTPPTSSNGTGQSPDARPVTGRFDGESAAPREPTLSEEYHRNVGLAQKLQDFCAAVEKAYQKEEAMHNTSLWSDPVVIVKEFNERAVSEAASPVMATRKSLSVAGASATDAEPMMSPTEAMLEREVQTMQTLQAIQTILDRNSDPAKPVQVDEVCEAARALEAMKQWSLAAVAAEPTVEEPETPAASMVSYGQQHAERVSATSLYPTTVTASTGKAAHPTATSETSQERRNVSGRTSVSAIHAGEEQQPGGYFAHLVENYLSNDDVDDALEALFAVMSESPTSAAAAAADADKKKKKSGSVTSVERKKWALITQNKGDGQLVVHQPNQRRFFISEETGEVMVVEGNAAPRSLTATEMEQQRVVGDSVRTLQEAVAAASKEHRARLIECYVQETLPKLTAEESEAERRGSSLSPAIAEQALVLVQALSSYDQQQKESVAEDTMSPRSHEVQTTKRLSFSEASSSNVNYPMQVQCVVSTMRVMVNEAHAYAEMDNSGIAEDQRGESIPPTSRKATILKVLQDEEVQEAFAALEEYTGEATTTSTSVSPKPPLRKAPRDSNPRNAAVPVTRVISIPERSLQEQQDLLGALNVLEVTFGAAPVSERPVMRLQRDVENVIGNNDVDVDEFRKKRTRFTTTKSTCDVSTMTEPIYSADDIETKRRTFMQQQQQRNARRSHGDDNVGSEYASEYMGDSNTRHDAIKSTEEQQQQQKKRQQLQSTEEYYGSHDDDNNNSYPEAAEGAVLSPHARKSAVQKKVSFNERSLPGAAPAPGMTSAEAEEGQGRRVTTADRSASPVRAVGPMSAEEEKCKVDTLEKEIRVYQEVISDMLRIVGVEDEELQKGEDALSNTLRLRQEISFYKKAEEPTLRREIGVRQEELASIYDAMEELIEFLKSVTTKEQEDVLGVPTIYRAKSMPDVFREKVYENGGTAEDANAKKTPWVTPCSEISAETANRGPVVKTVAPSDSRTTSSADGTRTSPSKKMASTSDGAVRAAPHGNSSSSNNASVPARLPLTSLTTLCQAPMRSPRTGEEAESPVVVKADVAPATVLEAVQQSVAWISDHYELYMELYRRYMEAARRGERLDELLDKSRDERDNYRQELDALKLLMDAQRRENEKMRTVLSALNVDLEASLASLAQQNQKNERLRKEAEALKGTAVRLQTTAEQQEFCEMGMVELAMKGEDLLEIENGIEQVGTFYDPELVAKKKAHLARNLRGINKFCRKMLAMLHEQVKFNTGSLESQRLCMLQGVAELEQRANYAQEELDFQHSTVLSSQGTVR